MIKKDFVNRKIKLIQEELGFLKKYKGYTFEEVAADFMKQAAVERIFQRIITRAIDINQHLIAEDGKGLEKIRSYKDTFLELSTMGVYPEEFAQEIALSAGFRNILVHDYDRVDTALVYNSVEKALAQYSLYCEYVFNYINKGE